MPSVMTPKSSVRALDLKATELSRSRAYILKKIMDMGLERRAADATFRPIHNSTEERRQVVFTYPQTRVEKLASWATQEGFSTAKLIRYLILEAIKDNWLDRIH